MGWRKAVVASHHNPQPEMPGRVRDEPLFAKERIPINVVPNS